MKNGCGFYLYTTGFLDHKEFHVPMRLISVIIPVYNRPSLLKEAVTSVFAQTFRDTEVIIVDDGSNDDTLKAARRLSESAPVPTWIVTISHTGRPGTVRNRGAVSAAGKYLAFLDSDDLWLPEKLEVHLDFMRAHPGLRISHTREVWIRNGKEISQSQQKHRREGFIFQDALKKCIIGPSTVMLEKTLFNEAGGFNEKLEIAEDYELWLKITANYPVGYIDQPLTVKRAGHGDQLSEKYGQIEYFRIQALSDLLDSYSLTAENYAMAVHELVRKLRIYITGLKKRGKVDETARYEALVKKFHP
ncbi:MAG: glycosyltransferase family A protein [Spirochaetota bacterium]